MKGTFLRNIRISYLVELLAVGLSAFGRFLGLVPQLLQLQLVMGLDPLAGEKNTRKDRYYGDRKWLIRELQSNIC